MSSVYQFFASLGNSLKMPPSFFQRMTGRISAAPVAPATVKPTEEELKADQEVVQKAISEAVTTALNNDDFTKAVAVHLATRLQPTLKSALNISTVEENLNRRLDEIQTATTARLADLSNDVNRSKSTDKTAALEEAVTQINVLLAALGKDVKAVQEQIAQQGTTVLSAHSEKLDTMAADIKTLQDGTVAAAVASQTGKLDALATDLKAVHTQIASLDTSLLSSHTTKFDAITTDLAAVKENADTAAAFRKITSEIASVKAEVETSAASTSAGVTGLSKQITALQSSVESQDGILFDIKSSNASPDILAGIKSSNESHASHTTALSTIASKDSSADIADLKAQVAILSTTVSELKTANISPEILSAVKSSNESHASHATVLSEIKTAASAPAAPAEKVDLSTIEADVKTVLKSLDSQTATLSDIKSVSSPPAKAEKTDITALEADVKTLLTNLKSHSDSVAGLKVSTGDSGNKILAAINTQDSVLAELKIAKQSPEVLAAIEKLQAEIAASKTQLTALKTAVDGIVIPKLDNAEVISEVKGIKTSISEIKDGEILTEVKEIKLLVGENATKTKIEVGLSDKSVEIVKENGVEVKEEAVEA